MKEHEITSSFFSDFVAKSVGGDVYITRKFFRDSDALVVKILNFGEELKLSINYLKSNEIKTKIIGKNKELGIVFKTRVDDNGVLQKSLISEYLDFEEQILNLSSGATEALVDYDYYDVFGRTEDSVFGVNAEKYRAYLDEKSEFFSKKHRDELNARKISILRNKLIATQVFKMSFFENKFNRDSSLDHLSDEDYDLRMNERFREAKVECMYNYPVIVISDENDEAVHINFEKEIRKSLKEESIILLKDYMQYPMQGKVFIQVKKEFFNTVREKYLKYKEFLEVSEEIKETFNNIPEHPDFSIFSIK